MKIHSLSLALAFLSGASASTSTFKGPDDKCPVLDEATCTLGVGPCDGSFIYDYTNSKRPVIRHTSLTPACEEGTEFKEYACLQTSGISVGSTVSLRECSGGEVQKFKYGYSGVIGLHEQGVTTVFVSCLGVDEAGTGWVTKECDGVVTWSMDEDPVATFNDGVGVEEPQGSTPDTTEQNTGGNGGGNEEGNEEGNKEEPQAPEQLPGEMDGGDVTVDAGFDGPDTVVDAIMGSANHTTLLELVKTAGLADALMMVGPYTVFAPTNDAFDMAVNETAMYLAPEYKMHLADILTYHVAEGKVMSGDLSAGALEMANGEETMIAFDPAPTINEVTISDTDIEAANGVVHVIDSVLLPPWTMVDLVTAASATDEFSSLVSFVIEANLTDALMGGPFTVFAPTNDAFAAIADLLPEDADERKAFLEAVLLNHVHGGIITSESAMNGDEIAMLGGESATYTVVEIQANSTADVLVTDNVTDVVVLASEPEYEYKLDDAVFLDSDYLVANGIIHVIDSVLIPSDLAGDKM